MTNQPRNTRLVKLILDADLVREMDKRILSSEGAYQDRNEYVTEAIRDRLAEESALSEQPKAAPPPRDRRATGRHIAEQLVGYVSPVQARDAEPMHELRVEGRPPTMPAPGGQLYLGDW